MDNLHFSEELQKEYNSSLINIAVGTVIPNNKKNLPPGVSNYYNHFIDTSNEEPLYKFEVIGETGIYHPIFKIKDDIIYSACDCKAGIKGNTCWHRKYILQGRSRRVIKKDASFTIELIKKASRNKKAILKMQQQRRKGTIIFMINETKNQVVRSVARFIKSVF